MTLKSSLIHNLWRKGVSLGMMALFIGLSACVAAQTTPISRETPTSSYKTPTYTLASKQTAEAEYKRNWAEEVDSWYYAEVTPVGEVADFLIAVYPPPGAMIAVEPDPLIIKIMFWADEIDEGCANVGDDLYERFQVFIDGMLVTRDQMMYWSMLEIGAFLDQNGDPICTFDNGPLQIDVYVDLIEGQHSAKFRITRNTGEILEYEWEFSQGY